MSYLDLCNHVARRLPDSTVSIGVCLRIQKGVRTMTCRIFVCGDKDSRTIEATTLGALKDMFDREYEYAPDGDADEQAERVDV